MICGSGLSFLLNFDSLIPTLRVVLNSDGPFSHNLTSKFEKGQLQHFSEIFPQCPIDTPPTVYASKALLRYVIGDILAKKTILKIDFSVCLFSPISLI